MVSGRHSLQIGDWYVFADTCTISAADGENQTKITPRSMDVLVYLAENAGTVISSSELLDRFWQGTISSDHAVHKAIAELRAAFGDKAHNSQYIKTVPKRGYSLVATMVPMTPAENTVTETRRWWQVQASSYPVKFATSIAALAIVLGILFFTEIDLALNQNNDISLAVMPFSQEGDFDESQQFFIEGLNRSLVTGLSKLNQLSISNPDESRGLNPRRQSLLEYGKQLGVEHLLDGSVQHVGDRTRITVQLIRVEDGIHQYSEQFDLTEQDLFAVQDQIVNNVVTSLSIHLDEAQRSKMRDWGTTNAIAFERFMKGEFYNNQFNPRDFRLAIDHHLAAIEADPNFINAYLGVVAAANNYAVYSGADKIAELESLIDEMHREVARLDPNHEALASIRAIRLRINGNDYRIQERSLREEILAGNAPEFALAHYALFLIGARLYDEAEQFLDVADEVDPFQISPDETWDYRLMVALPADKLERRKQQLLERPNHTGILGGIARALILFGQSEEAVGYQQKQRSLDDEGISSNFTDVVDGLLTGKLKPGSEALERQYALGRDFNFNNGALSFMLGDIDRGIEFWSNLAPVHKRRLINNVHVSEMYFADGVVEDPRYQAMLEDLDFGLGWQRTLMEGVMAMSTVTGVELSQAAKRAYASNQLMSRNNLWTESQWASIQQLVRKQQSTLQAAAQQH
jgi:DNA-binding winged helix-turn-helix (wHTH) protein/TolB-like protein/tetratricopeptide (TPR) repeat protein